MKEISDILHAYKIARKAKLKVALATVVKVEGSSYRRPGARMLITENGELTGAISGGCLEGDALRKALSAIAQQQNKLITYDNTDEEDAKIGVQLGCNGIVHILFEPIDSDDIHNPIAILNELLITRENAVLVTLFSLNGKEHPGTSMLYREKANVSKTPQLIKDQVKTDAINTLKKQSSSFTSYSLEGRTINAFLEFVRPPISLVIAGAGNDAQPLCKIAAYLGWSVTIADGRASHAQPHRFPDAANILITKPGQLLNQINIDSQTAFVLLTHNYNYDIELLHRLLKTEAAYIGVLGPKTKLKRMLDELNLNTEENNSRIHGPVGLDIGAETAEEIAISIIAEIKSVFSNASGNYLKDKSEPVHVFETKKW